jgi:hypothetical protein
MSEKSGGKATVSPDIRKIQEGMAKLKIEAEQRLLLKQQQDLKALQLKPFPDWPDDRRGAPNAVVRSAIFGVVRRGRRKRVVKMPVAAPGGWEVTLTGWRLDQYDCDIFLEVMHLARNSEPGGFVRFTVHGMLRRLGRTSDGQTNYTWLKQRLENLTETTIAFDNGKQFGVMGALISSFRIDRATGEGVVRTNPEMRPLFEDVTHLNIEQRRTLGQNQLAKSLHAVLASHVRWMPMRVDTLMQRIGAEYERLRDFKRDIRTALDNLMARGWIRGYKFIVSNGEELLEIDKVPTPSQIRAVARHQLSIATAATAKP